MKKTGQYNLYKADVFALGMTALGMATLTESSQCYDYTVG